MSDARSPLSVSPDGSSEPGRVSRRSRQAIVDAIADRGPATRLHLIDRTALSRATITAAVNELLAEGTLLETHPRSSHARGRQPAHLILSAPPGLVCGIDLGHHHIAVAVCPDATDLTAHEWISTEVDSDPSQALSTAMALATRLLADPSDSRPLLAISAIVPQPVSKADGRVVPTPFLTSWHGLDVAGRLRAEFGVPTAIENDANAGAIAEAGDHEKTTVFVKVSTGVGAGVVIGGALVRGYGGQAGEIGHLVVKADGQLCGCGNRGCLETLASVPAILRALEPVHGRLEESDLARLLASGDTASARAMHDAGEAVGTALAPIVAALQAQDVVIGGPLEVPMESLVRGVRARVESLVHPQVIQHLSIRAGTHGPLAPLVGAMKIAEATARTRARRPD
ncbi:ROK family protein [Microbacterium sp. DT81.1]|uniref:ROK family protein n=1 Tax=Microbacterium sp. DT81.1 TaxID=3393413 RepID=UPI003CE9C935